MRDFDAAELDRIITGNWEGDATYGSRDPILDALCATPGPDEEADMYDGLDCPVCEGVGCADCDHTGVYDHRRAARKYGTYARNLPEGGGTPAPPPPPPTGGAR